MARPQKNNCDYFPHSAQGRNDRRVKAICAKCGGLEAYAILYQLKELLTESDQNRIFYSELEIELIAGDLGITAKKLKEIIDHAIALNYFQIIDQFLRCEELENDLKPVYEKREKAKQIAAKQQRTNGKFSTDTTATTVVSVTEMPQSKLDKSRVNNINKEKNIEKRKNDFFNEVMAFENAYGKNLLDDFFNYWSEQNSKSTKMRFEFEKTFEIGKRLSRWEANNQNSSAQQKLNGHGINTKNGTSEKRLDAAAQWINGSA